MAKLILIIDQVVPMENLNGRKVVEAGDLCERRNGISFVFSVIRGYNWLVQSIEKLLFILCGR